MKKFSILTVMLLFMLSMANAQAVKRDPLKKLEGSQISDIAKNNFAEYFGNVPDVKWKRFDTFDQATFMKNGKEMTAFYDDRGMLVGTTTLSSASQLPGSAEKEINRQYKGYKITQVIFYKDNENNSTDMILYGTQFDDADNYFVELAKGNKKIVLRVDVMGNVLFFKDIS